MKFYHGTTEEYWKQIQEEGVLWGRRNQYWGEFPDGVWRINKEGIGSKVCRITWFAKRIEDAGIYDDRGVTDTPCIILEVDFPEITEYEGWQLVDYDPVPISRVRRLI